MEITTFVENVDRILNKNKKLYTFTALWGINWERHGSEIIFTRNGCYLARLDDRPSGSEKFSILNFHPMEEIEIIYWLGGVVEFIHKKLYQPNRNHVLLIKYPKSQNK